MMNKKKQKEKINDLIPKGVKHTVVPKEFLKTFPVWDQPKTKIIYVG